MDDRGALIARLRRGAGDYRTLASAKLRSDLQYRTSFVVMAIATFLITALDFAGIAVVFTNTPALGGWRLEQVAFLYGLAGISFGLADFVVGSVESVSRRIRDGSFDLLLIRPVNALVHLTAAEFTMRRLAKVLQAGAVFAVAISVVDVHWNPARVGVVIMAVLSGTVIASATWVLTSSVAFWTVHTQEIANSFTYGGELITSYPLHIFDQWLRVFLTYVVPLVFVTYLPALFILELETPLGLPGWLRFASPLAAVAATLGARTMWRAGLRHYRSTGS